MKDRQPGSEPPTADTAAVGPKGPVAKLGRDTQAKIGQQLRAMYDDVVEQGVPDRFAELLGRIAAGEKSGKP